MVADKPRVIVAALKIACMLISLLSLGSSSFRHIERLITRPVETFDKFTGRKAGSLNEKLSRDIKLFLVRAPTCSSR